VLSVTSGSSISYSVGAGSNSTSAGGDSWFVNTTTLLAKGGNSVANNTTNGTSGGQSSEGSGDIRFNGGNGANSTTTRGGGGGSSAGSSQIGNNGSGRTGGSAPTDGGAGGTAPDNGNQNGVAGGFPGGGGSGSARTSSTRTGGSGANGQIRISYQAFLTVSSPNDINIGTRAEYTITRNGPTTAAATVNLLSSGATGGQFFAAASGGTAITSVSIPVGNTSVTVYFTGNAGTHIVNFSSTGYLAASDVLVITQPASTVTVKSGTTSSFTFTGSAQGPGVSDFDFTGSAGTKSVLYTGVSPTTYNSATPPTNAGTYQVIASVAADSNFGSANSLPFAFTITRATVTITPDAGQSKFIGEVDPVLSFQYTGWIAPNNSSLLGGTLSRTAGETLGNYPITLGSLTESSGNYLLEFTAGVQFEIKIDPSMPVIEGTRTHVNNSETSSHTISLPTGIQTGALILVTFRIRDSRTVTSGPSGWNNLVDANNSGRTYVYYKTAQGSSENFSIGLSGSSRIAAVSYRISNWENTPQVAVTSSGTNPPNLNPGWGESPALFLAGLTFRESDQSISGIPSGFSNLIVAENTSNESNRYFEVGLVQKFSSASSEDPSSFSSGGANPTSFTIAIKGKRKVLTVVANPLSKVYGQADPDLTYTVTGFQDADNESILTGSLSRTAGQNVGTYAISQGNLAASDYIIEFTSADFSITPKTLSITPDSGQFKIVGESDPETLTFQTSGFEFSDTNSLLTGKLSRNEGEAAGFYPITLGSISSTGGNYSIDFTAGIPFEIRSNPTQYIVTSSTINPRAGSIISISAQLADKNGNAVAESGRVLTWSELIGTTGSFSSATSTTNTQGIATVQFTTSSSVGVSTNITASGSGGLFGTSPAILTVDVIPTQLIFVQNPSGSNTVAGQAFATQPIVQIRDAEGNLVSTATKVVTLSLIGGLGELRGNITLNAVNGVATFSGLNIDLVGSDKVILAESEGLTSATTSTFTITPAPASLFTKYAGDQQAAQVGTAVDLAPAVRVQDIFGNPISGVSVSFAVTSGGGSIEPTTTVLTDSDGIASLSSWTLGASLGNNTLTASTSGFSNLTFTALGSQDAVASFTSSTTWTVPPGVTSIIIEGWGGGGAGGGSTSTGSSFTARGGAGGGGGAYAKKTLPVTPGQVLELRVGTGGIGASGATGGAGNDTFIDGHSEQFLAKGGLGGSGNTAG
ncbi:MAG TPA: MBG domain-containing protein, partial [Bacteroidales bacterium]|nr:MBG domain-containing protein [Bacteroidales bacterium]